MRRAALVLGMLLAVSRAAAADDAFNLNQSLVVPANDALKATLNAERKRRNALIAATPAPSSSPDVLAQARPIGEREAPVYDPGLPKGFQYTLDVSSAWALGDTGYKTGNLPGGLDAVVAYGFSRHVRAYAGYFQLQEYPLGFDKGIVPVYLQGLGPPIATQDLHQQQVDVTTKDKFIIGLLQTLVVVGKNLPIPVPLIISPGYIARSANIGGGSDVQTIEINGFPQTVHLRSTEIKLVAVTLPLLSSPKIFVSYTIAPQWLINTNGGNQGNSAQLLQIFYAEYRLSENTTVYVQPSRAPNYLPPDPYPQHLASFIYGLTHSFNKWTFVQGNISTGTPTNYPQLGITSLTCQRLPCNPSQVAPSLGGLKATQIQLMFGIGKPTVIPL